jgi:hypothetical protein
VDIDVYSRVTPYGKIKERYDDEIQLAVPHVRYSKGQHQLALFRIEQFFIVWSLSTAFDPTLPFASLYA